MKKLIAISGLAALLPGLTNGQTNWAVTHPDVVAVKQTPVSRATAEAVFAAAVRVFALTNVPAAERTNVAVKAEQAFAVQTRLRAESLPAGTNRVPVYAGALAELATHSFTAYAGKQAGTCSNEFLEQLVVNHLAAGQTNLANQARNRMLVDSVTGWGIGHWVRAQFRLGNPASALNQAETMLRNGTIDEVTAYGIQNIVLAGVGFSAKVYQQPAQWESHIQQLPGGKARLKEMVEYCLTNFPAVTAAQCASAKLQLLWLRVEAGDSTNRVTKLRRLLRTVAKTTPVNEKTADFLGWLRGFHSSLKFSMPDESDPTAFHSDTPQRRLTVDERMDRAATLAGVTPPYPHSTWGERFRRGLTPEEAEEFAALRGQ